MSPTELPNPPAFFKRDRIKVDQSLESLLLDYTEADSVLADAMRYSTLLGGKRIRPVLVMSTARAFGASEAIALIAGCAVELMHAYSLIHDDLPAMDDDDLRRGQPTCHKAFNEATAILAGDALQTLAFEVLAGKLPKPGIPPCQQLQMIAELTRASGAKGMVAGQSIDLLAVGQNLDLAQLEAMHSRKTGALITASVVLGALCCPNPPSEVDLAALRRYSHAIGLAFQIQDDILDITGNTEALGKRQGADEQLNKPTYPSLLGLDGARSKLEQVHADALTALAQLDNLDVSELVQIADYIVHRTR